MCIQLALRLFGERPIESLAPSAGARVHGTEFTERLLETLAFELPLASLQLALDVLLVVEREHYVRSVVRRTPRGGGTRWPQQTRRRRARIEQLLILLAAREILELRSARSIWFIRNTVHYNMIN